MSQSDFVSRGQALVAAGQFQEAVKVCRLGLLGRPTTVEGRVVLGQALLALKRYDEVLAEMRVALELDHTSLPAQVLKAEALLRKGDLHPAIETLHKARQAAPGDPRILQLLAEAEHGAGRQSVSHPSVSFVGGDTKNYPGHSSGSGGEDTGADFSESFTQPTSLASPGSARRSSQRRAAVEPANTPPPATLDVGDKSGTVEVDPELEGVEVQGDIDFDDLAAPPKASKPAKIGGSRGSVRSSRGDNEGDGGTVAGKASAKSARMGAAKPNNKVVPTMALDLDDDEDVEELAETIAPEARLSSKKVGPGTAVRNAIAMPSGVIGDPMAARAKGKSVPPPRGKTASAPPQAAPLPPVPRNQIAAALPTMAAAPQPPPPFVQSSPFAAPPHSPYAAPSPAANLPTMAIQAQPPPPNNVDPMFGHDQQPAWARATVAVQPPIPDPRSLAAAQEETARPGQLDPAILALMSGPQASAMAPPGALPLEQVSIGTPPKGQMRTGVRRSRSRLQIALWVLIGIVVIGGGVFAGFQIRAMRLKKQIAAARLRETDLARTDTFGGWTSARVSLAGIVQAQATAENRAALARTRALIAYEFGDGLAEAEAAVKDVGTASLDGALASTYLALAQNDMKAARTAADAAIALGSGDPAALHASAEVALATGDPKAAVAALRTAADKEPRPLYGVALARAQAAVYNWDEAIAAIDRVLAGTADHPEAVIARGDILAASGRITPGVPLGNELRAQIERILYEGKRPAGEQQHGVSPTEMAFGFLSLAHVDYARGDINAARRDLRSASDINLDDQRFSEDAVDTLVMFGDLATARAQIDALMKEWPTSRRGRIALAQIYVAQGHPNDAIDLLAKAPDALALPMGAVVHGYAQMSLGDLVNAAADFDAVLKKLPTHEPAIIGRAWIDLANGDIDAATKRTAERVTQRGASPAMLTTYAAALRRSADPGARDKAKEMLEKVVAGPPGPDVARAQLELARIDRDLGMYLDARTAYTEAGKSGSVDAQLEHALLLIDDREPAAGRTMIEKLLKEAGDQPSGMLVIEGARARMLTGDHVGASQLLDRADKMSSVERWKLDRERGRLALRRSKFAEAAAALSRALDTCGSDADTFLLAADTGTTEAALADKVKKLAPQRLKGRPEEMIIVGKLAMAAGKEADAEAAYKRAQEALRNEKASRRRLAQADFGLALLAANRQNTVEAKNKLELVISEDPTIVDAYIFAATIAQSRPKELKKAFELAQKATELNPDYAYAWLMVGKLAHQMGDKRTFTDAKNRLTTIAPAGDELKELQGLH